LATDGDVRLGGRDWDEALLNFVAEQFIAQYGADPRKDPLALGELWVSIEEAKRTLSVRNRATIPVRHAGQVKDIEVTLEQFEELTEPLLERTSLTTRQVVAAAGVTWDNIDRVLLVGGATRMPMVGRMLARLSGKKPEQSVHPDEAVARGAVIFAGYRLAQSPVDEEDDVFAENVQFTEVDDDAGAVGVGDDHDKPPPGSAAFPSSSSAADLAARQLEKMFGAEKRSAAAPATSPLARQTTAKLSTTPKTSPMTKPTRKRDKGAAAFRVTEVNSHSLGIEGIHRKTDRKQNVVLIPRNTPLPARISHHFVTKQEDQRSVVVQVLEGDNADPEECARVGRAVLRDLPARLPRGWPVEVVYEYGANGRLSVYARVPRTESKITVEFEHDKALASERIRRWRRVIDANPGFDTFEALLEDVMHESETVPRGPPSATSEASAPVNADGVEAMALAADSGSQERDEDLLAANQNVRARRRFKRRNWAITIIGHVMAPVIGLLIGYYVLALLTPRGNFLNLPLPGLTTVEAPDADR
jgi:molecular chaperone DnaK (HSP70)